MPAVLWRRGFVIRAVAVGLCLGLFFGVLAWLDAGLLFVGAIVFTVMAVATGWWMARRMDRYWPGAKELPPDQRVAVVTAARRGERIADPGLGTAVVDYDRAVHLATENGKPVRLLVIFLLVVALATTLWDAMYGSWGNAIASVIYLVLILLEVFWWPERRATLLANTDRAAAAVDTDLPR